MRITVDDVLEYLASGMSEAEVLADLGAGCQRFNPTDELLDWNLRKGFGDVSNRAFNGHSSEPDPKLLGAGRQLPET